MPTSITADYSSQYEHRLMLKDGQEVFLRPILPTDGPLLVELFNKMSPQSRYWRFLRPIKALSGNLLYQFTHLNYNRDFALAGIIQEAGKEAIIAVGRYAQVPQKEVAELAVAVRDDWQHLGLGKALLATIIAIAKAHGIYRFESIMDPENMIIRQILLAFGYKVTYRVERGFLEVEIVV